MDVSSAIVDSQNSHNYIDHNSTMVVSTAVVDNLRARYWAFLFENLQRAVNELYQRCEMDGNMSECKEVILVLEDYTRKFHSLTERFHVKLENDSPTLCRTESTKVINEEKVVVEPENALETKLNGVEHNGDIIVATNESPIDVAKIPHDMSAALNIPTAESPVNDSVVKTDNTSQPSQPENVEPTVEIKVTPSVNGIVSTCLNEKKLNPKDTPRMSQSAKIPNIVRSKTSIEIKRRSNTAPLPLAPAPKTDSEGKESPPRSRHTSKDSDGWRTVISRSRKCIPSLLNAKDKPKPFDVNRRFYKPTPSSSLPTLAVMDAKEKSPDSSKIADKFKNRNRNNSQGSNNGKESTIQAEDYNRYKRNKERPIISNIAMFTAISPSRRKKSNEKDFKKKPAKESRQRKSENESPTKKMDENLIEEESFRKSKELYDKEMSLQQEINDLQNADLETDMDSDGTELDPEIVELCQNKHVNANQRRALLETKYNHVLSNMSWAEQIETLDKLEELLDKDPSGKSLRMAKNFTSLKQFEDLVARSFGKAKELRQKLSSPSRRRISPDTTILQHKARLAKARLNREQLLQYKSAKIRELTNKIAEVKAAQAMIVEERRKSLAQKLKRAEANRNLHLKNIQEKAHDEGIKQKEIAFINELEAQNKRHDFNALRQEQEDRFKSILEERQRRQEEKAAKDAAVEERRKAIEAERQEKIEELQEKMRKREERIDREFQEKERERIKIAREKARDREDRLLALQAAQIANAEELQKRIQQKQENSARRHEENIELIRQRAIEIGTPRLTPYQINKLCSVCNVVIDSEVFLLSHLRGTSHQEAIKKYREQFEASMKFSECSVIKDAPADILKEKKCREKERQKTLRKRCKKIRQRLSSRGEAYVKSISDKEQINKIDSSDKRKICKSIKEIEKLISTQGKGVWPNNAVTMLERNLFDLVRALEKTDKVNQQTFRELDGFTMLSNIYNIALDLPKNMSPYLPLKCFVVASNVYTNACNGNVDNCLHVLLSNDIVQVLDLLLNRLNLIMPNSDDRNGMVVYKADTLADVLMNLCSIIMRHINPLTVAETVTVYPCADITQHLQDVVTYTVCTGIVDKLAVYCSSVHDNKSADSYFLLHSIELLTSLVETRKGKITDKEDSTQLMATLRATELVGAVSMLYSMLLHRDSMSSTVTQSSTAELLQDVVNVIIATLRLFSKVCELNLEFFQNVLGAEGISLQVRHIISYLLRYCVQNEGYTNLLHHVIEFIGFFAIRHRDNQMILQSGSTPTVLQQLSNLPFAYFSNPNLVRILFPTLLACCVNNDQNRTILDQEMSYQLLEDFKNSVDSKDIPLIQLLQ